MSSQPVPIAKFPPTRVSPRISLETCPTCGQEIPPEKIEEIKGTIAARELEQRKAIALELQKQFATERAQAEAAANAALESERRSGAAREASAREEARLAAEKTIQEKQLEADRTQKEHDAEWQKQLNNEAAARQSAESKGADLKAEMEELRKNSALSIEAVRTEAKDREAQIIAEAKRMAESAANERIKAVEAAHSESTSEMQREIAAAAASLAAAQQQEAATEAKLDQLQKAKDVEIARIKEDAATQAASVRQAAVEETETRFQETLKAQQAAAGEANARASAAESKLLHLTEQQASELETSLNAQREILEKAKEAAVNLERAKAFQENQKLSNTVGALQRELARKSAEELGEGAEIELFEALKSDFPDDKITRIPKGTAGADIRQIVTERGRDCGTILYDSKNHKQFRWDHVTKLRTDQLAEKADHAILSTHKFPEGASQVHVHDGVILANPARVLSIAKILREHLVQINTLRLSNVERETKTAALYEFVTSPQCTDLLDRVDERADHLISLQQKEIRWHETNWRNQGEAVRAIQKARADLSNRIASIVGAVDEDLAASEAS